jgi:ABC-type polysaccharide/polyol phosphate export permease
VFKSETIPIAFTLTSIVTLGVGSFFLLVLLFLNGQSLTWYALLIIPVIILQFLFLIGLAFFISATTVFFRDILQIIPTILMVFLFFTPIYYSIDILPPFAAKITFFNPLYQMVQSYRDVLILHTFPNIFGLIYLLLLSILMIIVGLAYFRRLKGYFELAL